MKLEHLTVEFDSTDRSHPRFLVSTERTGHIAAVHEEHTGRYGTTPPTWIIHWRADVETRLNTRYGFRYEDLKGTLDVIADAVNQGLVAHPEVCPSCEERPIHPNWSTCEPCFDVDLAAVAERKRMGASGGAA